MKTPTFIILDRIDMYYVSKYIITIINS